MTLLAYTGSDAAHRAAVGRGAATDRYQSDKGSGIDYEFNGLGYRSEPFDGSASRHGFVIGSDFTFGVGVPIEQTWPCWVKRLLGSGDDAALHDVNVLNFSQGQASTDYIARTIVSQCAAVRPDFVIVEFGTLDAAEHISVDGYETIRPRPDPNIGVAATPTGARPRQPRTLTQGEVGSESAELRMRARQPEQNVSK